MNLSKDKLNRRSFLAAAPAAGAALVAGAPLTAEVPRKQFAPGEYLRVGALNVWDYSHLLGIWGPLINPRQDESSKEDMPFTGMRITHCWDINPDDAVRFGKRYGCQPVKNFDDMVGKVDAVISGGFYNHPWNHILHRPYLEAGLPNLINRPFSNSLSKAREMVDVARKHSATILTPSAMEHNDVISRAKAWATGKEIRCYSATNSFNDYATHGIHGVYLLYKAIVEAGNPIVSVAYRGDRWDRPPGVLTYEHRDPNGRQFFGTLNEVSGSWGTIQIHTPEAYGGESFNIHTGTGTPYDKTEVWAPTLWAFQRMALYGKMAQTFEQLLDRNNVYLAGFLSILEKQGQPVRLDQVPEDWRAPVWSEAENPSKTLALLEKKFGKG